MDRSDAAARLQRDEVLAWVGSSTASRQATRELARLGTPDPAVAGDELVQVVAVRVLARLDPPSPPRPAQPPRPA